MSVVEVRPHLYRLVLGRYQAFVWFDEDSLTLIDTGEVGSAPAIAEALRELGRTPADLDRVVLTHFHDDHVGSAAEISSWGDVQVVAHVADAPVIRGEMPGPPPNIDDVERELHAKVADGLLPAPPVRVDLEVRDGDVLDFAGGAYVISTPGHTDGSIAVHLPQHRVLITGDIAAEYQGGVMLGVFNLDRAEASTSFRRLADLDVDVVCLGHGEPVIGNAGARLREVATGLSTRDVAGGRGRESAIMNAIAAIKAVRRGWYDAADGLLERGFARINRPDPGGPWLGRVSGLAADSAVQEPRLGSLAAEVEALARDLLG